MEGLEFGQTVVVKLNLVAQELSGKLLLMGCCVFEENNVEEGGISFQDQVLRRSYVKGSAANCVFYWELKCNEFFLACNKIEQIMPFRFTQNHSKVYRMLHNVLKAF